MTVRNPTPKELLVDQQGRPYFLWDANLTLAEFEALLRSGDRPTRAYLAGKLMRQAKPDDVFTFLSEGAIRDLWPDVQPYLGRTKPFWDWLLATWTPR